MSEKKEIQNKPVQPAEQEIDLIELAQKVWAERKLIFKVCGVALLLGLVVAISIPKEYATSVTLAPEATGKVNTQSGVNALAAMAGVNLNSSSGQDALSPDLYPDIVSSTPFLVDLFHIKVKSEDSLINTTLYQYLDKEQRAPWWGVVTSAPFKALGWVISTVKGEKDDMLSDSAKVDPFQLNIKQSRILKKLDARILVTVEKKTGMTTITVTMQDPLISATVTDSVMSRLQNHITAYRTSKARKDLVFAQKLYREAKASYTIAQKKYAAFADANQNLILFSYRSEQERLQNEMTLAYNVYSQTAQQLQMAKAKVQEITPVYTVVQPATVPLKPAKPNKMMILIGFIFLGGVGSVGWILFIKDLFRRFKKA